MRPAMTRDSVPTPALLLDLDAIHALRGDTADAMWAVAARGTSQ